MKGDEQRKAQPRAAQSDKGLRRMLTLGGLLSEMQAHKCDRCRRDGPAVIPCEVPAHSCFVRVDHSPVGYRRQLLFF